MSKNMELFKEYIKKNPKLKDLVLNKKRTWQDIYEEFILTDNNTFIENENINVNNKSSSNNVESIKNIISYIKKIDPDQVSKTVDSIKKVMDLIMSFGGGSGVSKSTLDPLFDTKFDEWY